MNQKVIEEFNRGVNNLKSKLIGDETVTKTQLQEIIGELASIIESALKKI